MHNRKFFRNAAIAFGLLAAGTSFAAETTPSAPVANIPEQHEGAPAGMHPKMEQMTPEQHEAFRAEMKAKMDKMSPEQRAAMKSEHMEHRAAHREHRAEHSGKRFQH